MIFSQQQRAQNIARSHRHFTAHDFLITRAWLDIADRIQTIKRNFPRTLILSNRGSDHAITLLQDVQKITNDITLTAPDHNGILKITPGTFDLVISVFDAHISNNLDLFLFQLHAALAPKGACFIAFPGGDTLADVRQYITRAEIELTGGASPRIHPFIDRAAFAGLMQKAGFSLPVVDHDTVTIHYTSTARAFKDIRGMGETNCLAARSRRFAPRRLFTRAEELFRADLNLQHDLGTPTAHLPVRVEILHASGWAG